MSTLRMIGMLLVCGLLGYLVWLDNFAGDGGLAPPRIGHLERGEAALPANSDPRQEDVIGTPSSDDGHELADEAAAAPQATSEFTDEANMERAAADTAEEDVADDNNAEEDRVANPLSSVDISLLSDTVERPLFASSRQRPPPKDEASEPSENSPATFELLGVVVSDARATAILRRIESGANYSVMVGDSLSGWKIAQIDLTSVVLEEPGGAVQRIELVRK